MGKILLILAGIAIVGVVLIGGGAWYWWSHHSTEFLEAGKTAILDGEASGRTLDENGCMIRAVERHKADWNRNIVSAVRNNLWLTGCLETSRVQVKFCDDIPSNDNLLGAGVWAATACANNDLSDSYCANLFSTAVKYCSSPQRAAKLPAPAVKS